MTNPTLDRPVKVARATGSGASVPIECCQACGEQQARDDPFARLYAAGEPDGADRRPAATTTVVSNDVALLPALRVGAAWSRRRSGNHLSSGLSLYQRHHQAVARQFRRPVRESSTLLGLKADDLVIDIGSNDGTLLSNFQMAGYRVLGIEPTDVGRIAASRGIPTVTALFHSCRCRRGRSPIRPGEGRHRRQLLCAYRGCACDHRRYRRDACA